MKSSKKTARATPKQAKSPEPAMKPEVAEGLGLDPVPYGGKRGDEEA